MNPELPQTEAIDPHGAGLDRLASAELVERIVGSQADAVDAVRAQEIVIAEIVDAIAARLRAGGRLHYVGAGTSGRLGVLDASEMPPTFGTPPELVCAHIAGGSPALVSAVEGAEDDGDAGARAMRDHVQAGDAVIGISASGSASYVVEAIHAARALGAYTVGIVNTDQSRLGSAVERVVVLRTGAEVIAGSTRLKAGTAQKIALNAISTAVMVRLGKVYDNLMVDVVATNRKLRDRALRLVRRLTQLDEPRAAALLEAAEGRVKVAVVMARRDVTAEQARKLLIDASGNLRDLM